MAKDKQLFPDIPQGRMSEMHLIDAEFRKWLGKEIGMWDELTDSEKRIWYAQYIIQSAVREPRRLPPER